MNVYDKAYELTKALKESPEWKQLRAAREAVENDKQVHDMYISLRSKQLELQQKQVAGEELDPSELEVLQKQYDVALMHSSFQSLVEAENRITMILEDVQKIIYEAISSN